MLIKLIAKKDLTDNIKKSDVCYFDTSLPYVKGENGEDYYLLLKYNFIYIFTYATKTKLLSGFEIAKWTREESRNYNYAKRLKYQMVYEEIVSRFHLKMSDKLQEVLTQENNTLENIKNENII